MAHKPLFARGKCAIVLATNTHKISKKDVITIGKEHSITKYEGAKSSNVELAAASIGADVKNKIVALQESANRGRVDLSDTDAVREATYQYMQKCGDTGAIPTVMGLSASLGVSRRWLNLYMREHPNNATTRFLEVVKETFADAITQAGLYKHIDGALSIFILKNCASMSDRVEVEAIPPRANTDTMDPEELRRRILADIPEDILEDDDE